MITNQVGTVILGIALLLSLRDIYGHSKDEYDDDEMFKKEFGDEVGFFINSCEKAISSHCYGIKCVDCFLRWIINWFHLIFSAFPKELSVPEDW